MRAAIKRILLLHPTGTEPDPYFAEPDPYLHAGFWPLGPRKGWLGRAYTSFCCREAPKYFKLRVVTEEGATFDHSKPYVVGEWTQLQELLPQHNAPGRMNAADRQQAHHRLSTDTTAHTTTLFGDVVVVVVVVCVCVGGGVVTRPSWLCPRLTDSLLCTNVFNINTLRP